MRDDQRKRLQELSERITEQVILDADPKHWYANGITPDAMTKDERGDAYWSRKLAASSLSVLTKLQSVIGIVERDRKPGDQDDDADVSIENDIKRAERKAKQYLAEIMGKRAKGPRAERV